MDEARRIQIGKRLRELREAARLTQPQAAERASIGFRTYQSYEYGENATDVETYEKLATVFGVPVSQILGTADGEPPWAAGLREQLTEVLDRLDLWEAVFLAGEIGQRSGSGTQQGGADAGAATGP